MQVKVNYKDALKGLKRKQNKFGEKLMKEIFYEALEESTKIDVPVVTGRLAGSYTATRPKKYVVRMGSQDKKSGGNPVKYANWIETGRRGGVQRIGGRGYWYYFAKGGSKKWVTSAPRNVGLGAFKKAKENVVKAIPKLARKININKL